MVYNIQSSSNNTEAGECESQFIGMQGRIEHMIHNTRHCVHPTEIGAILMGVSENEILFLHYYHINQAFLRRQLISILTDRQTEVFVTGVKHHIHIAATPFFIHLLYV